MPSPSRGGEAIKLRSRLEAACPGKLAFDIGPRVTFGASKNILLPGPRKTAIEVQAEAAQRKFDSVTADLWNRRVETWDRIAKEDMEKEQAAAEAAGAALMGLINKLSGENRRAAVRVLTQRRKEAEKLGDMKRVRELDYYLERIRKDPPPPKA